MKEVFISHRLNRWGRRFGFVRFFEVSNVGRLEKKLDQIYIGHKKLHVNILRYRRDDLSKGTPIEARKPYGHEPAKNKVKEVWREKKGKVVAKTTLRNQSYVDVVRVKKRSGKERLSKPSTKSFCGWLIVW